MKTFFRTSFGIGGAIGALIGTALLGLAAGPPVGAEESPAPPTTEEAFPDLSADLVTTLIDRNGHRAETTQRIFRTGRIIRYENRRADPVEVSIFDFETLKEFRIFKSDQIYFETPIAHRVSMKVQREGLIPKQEIPGLTTRRIVLREDQIEGHPCEIVLLIREMKERKNVRPDYTLVWEAKDLSRQSLRVAYHQANFAQVVIRLQNIEVRAIDPELVKPPADFINMSPF